MIRKDLASLPVYVPGAREQSADTIKLSSNESAAGPLPSVQEAMDKALAGANRYPNMGAVELREALASHLGVTFDEVAVGTGSSALCQQLVCATAQPGDEVIFPWRSFEAYPIFVQIAGATARPIPLDAQHRVDLEAMARAITDSTRLIFMCNPNNPTGTTITTAEWDAFMAKVPAHVTVALDEAYFEYNRAADTPVATEEITKYPNVVGLRTFSKAYGLAGVRVGYAFGPAELIEGINKVAVPFSVSSVAQAGALASLEASEELAARVEKTCAQRERLTETLKAFGTPESQTNFVWLPNTPKDFAADLADHDVLVRSFPEGTRITVTNEEETNALLRALDTVLD